MLVVVCQASGRVIACWKVGRRQTRTSRKRQLSGWERVSGMICHFCNGLKEQANSMTKLVRSNSRDDGFQPKTDNESKRQLSKHPTNIELSLLCSNSDPDSFGCPTTLSLACCWRGVCFRGSVLLHILARCGHQVVFFSRVYDA